MRLLEYSRGVMSQNDMAMRVRDLPEADQSLLQGCLLFVVESGELQAEFDARMGVTEAEARQVLDEWPDVDDVADDSIAVLAINNAMNEVCHGVDVSDWDRWFAASPGDVKAAYVRWARGRGWSTTGVRCRLALLSLLVIALFSSNCAWHESNPGASAESTAIETLRDTVGALAAFRHACDGYPRDLTALLSDSPSADCAPARAASGAPPVRIPALPKPEPGGYAFIYRPVDALPDGRCVHYKLRAVWTGDEATRRNFWVSDAGTIHAANTHQAGPADPEVR